MKEFCALVALFAASSAASAGLHIVGVRNIALGSSWSVSIAGDSTGGVQPGGTPCDEQGNFFLGLTAMEGGPVYPIWGAGNASFIQTPTPDITYSGSYVDMGFSEDSAVYDNVFYNTNPYIGTYWRFTLQDATSRPLTGTLVSSIGLHGDVAGNATLLLMDCYGNRLDIAQFSVTASLTMPEPATLVILGLGALALRGRRKTITRWKTSKSVTYIHLFSSK